MAREPKNLRVDSCETWYLSHTCVYDNTQVATSRAPNSPDRTKVGGANPNLARAKLHRRPGYLDGRVRAHPFVSPLGTRLGADSAAVRWVVGGPAHVDFTPLLHCLDGYVEAVVEFTSHGAVVEFTSLGAVEGADLHEARICADTSHLHRCIVVDATLESRRPLVLLFERIVLRRGW